MTALQGSLLDLADEEELGDLRRGLEHIELGRGAWLDLRRGWVAGQASLFELLAGAIPWQLERRRMYDRVVDVPRLHAFYDDGAPLPDPRLDEMRAALDAHYAPVLRERFVSLGLCWYRDGRDSVAWHGDTIGRGSHEDTLVAIVSVGAPRRLLIRPLGGGEPARRFELGLGDLLVMGGSCQRTFEHAVPKSSRPVGPRNSVQFRPRGVR